MSDESCSLPPRVIPSLGGDAPIVRCRCCLRVPCGEMVRCTRCGCLSHLSCVGVRDPFVCSFCHVSAQKLLADHFNKAAAGGAVIDRFRLHDHVVNVMRPIEVCELREHSYASGHVAELIRTLALHVASLDLALCRLENHLKDPVYEPMREDLKKAIESDKKLYNRHAEILLEILNRYQKMKNSQNILPDFRDVVIQELL